MEGNIDVKHVQNGYNIEVKFVSTEGVKIKIIYDGMMKFINRGVEDNQTIIENPVDVIFTNATIIYEHSNMNADNPYDRFSINLWNRKLDENDQKVTNDYVIHADLQSEALSSK